MRNGALVVVLVAVAASAAHAGDPPEEERLARLVKLQTMRKDAEQLEKAARESGDLDGYTRCGEAYVALANTTRSMGDPGDDLPELLYNASVCFAWGGSVGAALRLSDELIRTYPKDRLAAMALGRRAQLRRVIGDYAGAAEDLETFARRYAGEVDAYAALSDAVYYRAALDDRAKLKADLQYFIKTFGAKRVDDAVLAGLQLARVEAEGKKPAAAAAEYLGWVKRYGGKAERATLAYVWKTVGELELEAACPVKLADGLCVQRVRAPRGAARCNAAVTPVMAVARDAAGMKRATIALRTAIHAGESVPGDDRARRIVAEARLALAIPAIEAAIAAPPPPLVLDRAGKITEASRRAATGWIGTAMRAQAEADRALEPVLAVPLPRQAVVALGRRASVAADLADQLAAAPLPAGKKPADEAGRADYCDEMIAQADVAYSRARELAARCVELAAESGLVEEAATCRHLHDRLAPPARTAASGDTHERLPAAAWPGPVAIGALEAPVTRAPTPPRP